MYGGSVLSGSESFKTITKNMAYYIQQHGGGSFTTALKQGQSLLMSNVSSQAYIQGINDDFLIAAFISILGFIPILLLKSKKKDSASMESEHVAMME